MASVDQHSSLPRPRPPSRPFWARSRKCSPSRDCASLWRSRRQVRRPVPPVHHGCDVAIRLEEERAQEIFDFLDNKGFFQDLSLFYIARAFVAEKKGHCGKAEDFYRTGCARIASPD